MKNNTWIKKNLDVPILMKNAQKGNEITEKEKKKLNENLWEMRDEESNIKD